MRVLWLSPWLRPLARLQIEALSKHGVQTMLVTSDQHPEPLAPRDYEVVVRPRPKSPGSYPELGRALRAARQFAPDVVIAELVFDPRWLAFAALAPVIHAIHDDQPHDPTEIRPAWQRRLYDHWTRRADRIVVFSGFVHDILAARGLVTTVVPLTTDLDPLDVPEFVPAARRRDVVLFGRLLPYKNVEVALAAWHAHVAGEGWRGDQLVLLGDGTIDSPLPPHTLWRRERYSYADVVPVLARAKASLVHYRQASQSGVQLLSMQLGVAPIVSPRGAMFEMQPPGAPVVDVEDVEGLRAALDLLADPVVAARLGADAAATFRRSYTPERAAAAWLPVLTATIDPDRVEATDVVP